MTEKSFTERIKEAIKRIPKGKVSTYGQVAAVAGNPRGARQVSWVLNASSEKDNLPWYRVINSKGTISLPLGGGFEQQKAILESEGVVFDAKDRVDLDRYLWNPFPGESK